MAETITKHDVEEIVGKAVNRAVEDLSEVISDFAKQVDKRFNEVDARFEQVDARFEQVDARFGQVDARFEQVDARFDKMDRRFDGIDLEIRKIHAEQTEMRQWMEHIDNRLMGVESDIKEIYDRIVALEKKAPNLTSSEQAELSQKFESMLKWAQLVSKKTGVALPKF